MNRSLARERFETAGISPGEVLVITEFDHPGRGPVRCSAAPAVSGWLRRRGFPVRGGPAPRPVPSPSPSPGSVLFTATYLDRDGHAVGFGAAAASPGLAAAAAAAVRAWASVMRTRRAVLVAYAAPDRLGAIRRAAEVSDVVIVAGARGCADSRQVLQAAAAAGARAYLADRADDICPEWLDRSSTIGLTTGLGARPELTGEVLTTLSGLGPLSVTRVDVSTEIVTARYAAAQRPSR